MKKKTTINKKHLIIYTLSILFFLTILPIISIKIFPPILKSETIPRDKVDIPSKISLYITKSKKTITLSFEEYVKGVVASEMPDTFDMEALKAQAVASRTYALGKIVSGSKLCDSTHCQVYRDNNISSKVAKAVKSTNGQVLYYNGSLAKSPFYFSSSGGKTENSQDVFISQVPYLKSVESPYENHATHINEKKVYSLESFSRKIKEAFPGNTFGKITSANIKIISRSTGGRVKRIKIGKVVLKGVELRTALSLYSTNLSLKVSKNKVTITTKGSGHGVGMSQYGADGYAKRGYTYQQILSHYYNGTTIYPTKKN